MIRNDACWRIGNGKRVRIWGESWLPDAQCPFVMSPLCNDLKNEKVSSWMIKVGNNWDPDILRDLFDERDRDIIARIPLSNISRDDCWRGHLKRKKFIQLKVHTEC